MTLMEVIFAVIVLALGISTSITTLQVGYRSIDTARNTTLAGQVLQSMIEEIRLKQYSDSSLAVGSTSGSVSSFDTTGAFSGFNSTATTMLGRFTITKTITLPQTDLKMIVLTATWNGIDGKSHTVKYTTYYAKNGLYDYYYTT